MKPVNYEQVLEDLRGRRAELEDEMNKVASAIDCIEILLEGRRTAKKISGGGGQVIPKKSKGMKPAAEGGEAGAAECPLCLGPQKKTAVCKGCGVTACKKCVKYGRCPDCHKRKEAGAKGSEHK
jgi:hypothetical protein